jgi:hypothetical protein
MARTRQDTGTAPSDGMVTKSVRMRLEKETPGAVRYMEVDDHGSKLITDADGAVLGSLYIRKAAMRKWVGNDSIPRTLVVNLSTLPS